MPSLRKASGMTGSSVSLLLTEGTGAGASSSSQLGSDGGAGSDAVAVSPWHPGISQYGIKMTYEGRSHRDAIHAVAISEDGSTAFSVGRDSTLKIFAVNEKRQLRSSKICELALSSLSVTKDCKQALIGSWDNSVYVYSVEFGRVIETLVAHEDAVSSMALSDSHLLTGSWDSTVKLWQRKPPGLHKIPVASFFDHETEVKCVAISADGRLGVSGAIDGVIHIFDIRSAKSVQSVQAHQDSVNQLSFTADNKKLVSCSDDASAKLREVGGSEITSLSTMGPASCLLADPSGRLVVVGSESGHLSISDFSSGQELHALDLPSGIRCLAGSKDASSILSGGSDACLRLFLPNDS